MTTQLQFQLSLDDYLTAQKLHATRSFWSRLVRVLNFYIYPAIGVTCFLICVILWIEKVSDSSPFILMICGIILVCCPIYQHYCLRRCYKRTRSGSDGCQLTFDEESIGVEGQYAKGEMDWKAIHFFREDQSIFLLYLAPASFIAVPKRVCTEEQIAELRSLLSRQVMPVSA